MQKSETIAELAKALCSAQGELKPAEKGSENPHFKSKYADLTEVWDACRPALTKHGLSVTQLPVAGDTGTLFLETMLLHTSGEWISSMISMPLPQASPQGYGSAMTYARRYGLAAIVGVVQEDDDGNAGSQGHEKSQTPQQPRPAPRGDAQPPQQGGTTMRDFFKALEGAGLMEPDPEQEGRNKVSGKYYGLCEKHNMSKAWSKYTPEGYAGAIAMVAEYVAEKNAQPAFSDELDGLEDPFQDQG